MSAAENGMLAGGERVSRNSSTCTAFMMLSENMTATAYKELYVLVGSTLPMLVLRIRKKGDGFRYRKPNKSQNSYLQVAFSQLLAHKCLLANEGAQGRVDVAERCWIAFNNGACLSNSDRFSHIPYKFLQWRAHGLGIVANHIGQCPWGSILSWLINHPQNR